MAQNQTFNLADLLTGLTSPAAFGAAQYGLPQGQQFNYNPAAQAPQGNKLWNALGYAGDVLGAIGSSGEGGWAGPALRAVSQRRNAQSYNQAIQNAKLAEAMQAAQQRQQQLADYNSVNSQQFLTPEVAKQYMTGMTIPLGVRSGQYQQDLGRGQDALSAFQQLAAQGFGGTSPQDVGMAAPQSGQPPQQGGANTGFGTIDAATGKMVYLPSTPKGQIGQFSAGASQTQVPDYSSIPVTPASLDMFLGGRDRNLTRDETARKNRQDELLRQQQLRQQSLYQQGQLDVQRQNAATNRQRAGSYAQSVNQMGAYQRGKLAKAERAAAQRNPTKVSELRMLLDNGTIDMKQYIESISDGFIEVPEQKIAPRPTQGRQGGKPSVGKYGQMFGF